LDVFKIKHDIRDAAFFIFCSEDIWVIPSPNACAPSLHALVYQLCILCMSLGTPSSIKSGRNGLPYSKFTGQSANFCMSSTPTTRWCSESVQGKEKPGRLLALESETSFDLTFDPYLLFAACHISAISSFSLS
jgi:hypothetical protein